LRAFQAIDDTPVLRIYVSGLPQPPSPSRVVNRRRLLGKFARLNAHLELEAELTPLS
jgi:hypothetical protein